MVPPLQLTGQKFGRLTVVERAGSIKDAAAWKCLCECGKETTVVSEHLRSGNTRSCGCLRLELSSTANIKHGHSPWRGERSPEYRAWCAMITRCTNEKAVNYENYGGRGITVCDEWRESFQSFFDDMGRKPTPAHTLDRKNNALGYNAQNCRWASRKEQAINRRQFKEWRNADENGKKIKRVASKI